METTKVATSGLLIQWANSEAGWIRQIVLDVLASKNKASDKDIGRYFELFLREKHLRPEPAPTIPLIPETPLDTDKSDVLTLLSLTIKAGVNALQNGQVLEFGPSLTVIFGENGSGKSGYVRVLKRAAGVRTAEEILGNVHNTKASTPEADFEIALSGKSQPTVHWKNEEQLAPLTYISVFDSRAAGLYVDEDLTYLYTPGELALFPLVQDAVDRVRAKLVEEIARTTDPRNPFLLHFKRGTSVFPLIEKLGAGSDLAALKNLASLTESDEAHKTQLVTEVDSLKSADLRARLKVAEDQLTLLKGCADSLEAVYQFDSHVFREALEQVKLATDKEKEITTTAFAESPILGVLSEPWRRFIEAGEEYLKTIEQNQPYPKDNSVCLYCQQPLTSPALELLHKYREYASGQARRELNRASQHLKTCCATITEIDVDSCASRINTEIEQDRGASFAFLVEPLKTAQKFKKAVQDGNSELPDVSGLSSAIKTAKEIVGKLNETIIALRSKAVERERLLATRQSELAELEARVTLSTLWTGIEKKIQDAKWADGASQISKGFSGILRSLTEQAKVATQTLLNTNFETLFIEEAKALRAPTVILQFPGAKGQALRRKVVGDHRPSEILSEGEQKAVALADFFAETRVRQPNGPVIFDDPVNSLDLRRAKEVAERIVNLAKTHQVIIFTHNVMFASVLLENADRKTSKYIDIKNDGAPGIVSIGTHPRTDSASDITKRIESKIAAARTSSGEVQESLLESGYANIRALTEVITERGLLRSITARYRANVRVDGLEKLNTDKMQDAIKIVVDIYGKACRYIEAHSQPLDHLGLKPTVTELVTDLASLRDIIKKYPIVD